MVGTHRSSRCAVTFHGSQKRDLLANRFFLSILWWLETTAVHAARQLRSRGEVALVDEALVGDRL